MSFTPLVIASQCHSRSLRTETQDWAERAGSPDYASQKIVDYVIEKAIDNDWWDQLNVLVLCLPGDAALTWLREDISTPVLTNGMSQVPPFGIVGDGVNDELDLNLTCADVPDLTLTSNTQILGCTTNIAGTAADCGAQTSTRSFQIRMRSGGSASIWPMADTQVLASTITAVGIRGHVRNGANSGFLINEANQTALTLAATASFPVSDIKIGRTGQSGVFSRNRYAFYAVGPEISSDAARDVVATYHSILEQLGIHDFIYAPDPGDAEDNVEANAFSRTTINSVLPAGSQVIMRSPPPQTNAETGTKYKNFPLTSAWTKPYAATASANWTAGSVGEDIWIMRSLELDSSGNPTVGNRKANPTVKPVLNSLAQPCLLEFSSYDKAEIAVDGYLMYTLGYDAFEDEDHPQGLGWVPVFGQQFDVEGWTQYQGNVAALTTDINTGDTGDILRNAYVAVAANADAVFNRNAVAVNNAKASRDKVILGPGRMADMVSASRIMFDAEPADKRTPQRLISQARRWNRLIHGKGFTASYFFNSLHVGGAIASGVDVSNFYQMFSPADETGDPADFVDVVAGNLIPSGEMEAYLNAQFDVLKGPGGNLAVPYDKLIVAVHVGAPGLEMPVANATKVYEMIRDLGMAGRAYIPIGARFGGALSNAWNQVIAATNGLPLS